VRTEIEQLRAALAERDFEQFELAMGAVHAAAGSADGAELAEAVAALAEIVDQTPIGPGAAVATLGGALVEGGAPAAPLVEPVLRQYADMLERCRAFVTDWTALTGEPVPAPEEEAIDEIALRLGIAGNPVADSRMGGWYLLESWTRPVFALLQKADGRAALTGRTELVAAVEALLEYRPEVQWVAGLLAVVDNDPLVVLHRATGRGFLLTISGVSDNFQLATLLAGALVTPGLVPGRAPDPSWVATATDAPMDTWHGTVRGEFNLVDVAGKWIWNEGRPADIPVVDGRRVVVLDPQPYERSWNSARQYPLMSATITLERELTPDEAGTWLAAVQPAGAQ